MAEAAFFIVGIYEIVVRIFGSENLLQIVVLNCDFYAYEIEMNFYFMLFPTSIYDYKYKNIVFL
jgi:hypothetical protein